MPAFLSRKLRRSRKNQRRLTAGAGFVSGAIKCRIGHIDVLLIHLFRRQTQRLAEALVVHDLALTQKPDHIRHIRVVAKPQNVVIGLARLLLWGDLVSTTYTKI